MSSALTLKSLYLAHTLHLFHMILTVNSVISLNSIRGLSLQKSALCDVGPVFLYFRSK